MLNLHAESAAYDRERLLIFRSPWWLKSEWGSERLVASFGDKKVANLELSFDVVLASGRGLASTEATRLRQEIWDYLCLQGQPNTYGSRQRSSLIDRRHLVRAAKIVDALLLRGDKAFLSHGFRAVPDSHWTQLLIDIGRSEQASAGLYGWRSRLERWLRGSIANVEDDDVEEVVGREPGLAEIDPALERTLGLTNDDLIRARAVVYQMGLELNRSSGWVGTHSRAVCLAIQHELYRGTLLVPARAVDLRLPAELCWWTMPSERRELVGAPIAQGREDRTCSRTKVEEYRQCILSWRHLSTFGVGPSPEVLREIKRRDIENLVALKNDFGFEPVPPPVVAECLRNAIVFFYENHEHLLASLSRVLKRNRGRRINSRELVFFQKRDIAAASHRYGIRVWSIAPAKACKQTEYVQYISDLRRTRAGLLDMALVLHGACQVIVGGLEAGRVGELLELRASSLLPSREWIQLFSRKSGYEGVRRQDAIPCPEVVADVIEALGAFFSACGYTDVPIFSAPTLTGQVRADYRRSYHALDLFCDYFQSPTDEQGRRYYLRPHQLRKFFAALFFHCCGFAGLDTLRWFLRHLDAKHLWNYIRGITPGEQMHHYMAEAGVLLLRNGAPELDALTRLIYSRYKLVSLEVVSDRVLEGILQELQEEGEIQFEPIFADGSNLEGVRLGVVVWGALDD